MYILTYIANCNINICDTADMKLGEKIRYLREVEGSLRGLGRPMTQLEMVRAIRQDCARASASPTSRRSKTERART